MSSSFITSWQTDGEIETVTDFIFLGSKITADSDCSHEIKRCLLLGRKAMTNLDSIFKSKVMSLLFNALSRFVKVFLPRSKHLLISWLQSPSTVILEPKKIKSAILAIFSPSICYEVMGPDATILLFFECGVLSQLFILFFHPHQSSLVSLLFLPLWWSHLHI